VITIFSIPKAFSGPVAAAQSAAVRSWIALGDVQVALVGDDEGVREAASEAGVGHISGVAHSGQGTPRLDDAFARVDAVAEHSVHCFVNSDIILLDDFLPALRVVRDFAPRTLMVGQTRDLARPAHLDVTVPGWASILREQALREGVLRGTAAIDYFVFDAGLFRDLPPFLVGRAGFDNWLIWRSRSLGVPVVDVTADVVAVHQTHDYDHLSGGKEQAYLGDEATRNRELAGGKGHLYSICDASHLLRNGRVVRNPWATFRAGDRLRRARWKLGLDRPPRPLETAGR
jgi:hypothetical protein